MPPALTPHVAEGLREESAPPSVAATTALPAEESGEDEVQQEIVAATATANAEATPAPTDSLPPSPETPEVDERDALYPALIALLAVLLLWLLLLWTRITIVYTLKDGKEYVKRRYFRRLRKRDGMELDITLEDCAKALEEVQMTLTFGRWYRRRGFYEKPIRLLFDKKSARPNIPAKDRFKDEKGLHCKGNAFK